MKGQIERISIQHNGCIRQPTLQQTGHLLLEFIQHSKGLIDFAVHGLGVIQEVKELGVVHLQEHTGDLASQIGLVTRNRNQ